MADVNLLPVMTSNTSGGVTVSGTTGFSADANRFLVADHNSGTAYTCTDGSNTPLPFDIIFDFGAALQTVNSYAITANGGTPTRDPQAWTLLGSNDGASYSTINTQSAQTGWGASERRTFGSGLNATYRYYKWHMTAANAGGFCTINEIELIGFQISQFFPRDPRKYLYLRR